MAAYRDSAQRVSCIVLGIYSLLCSSERAGARTAIIPHIMIVQTSQHAVGRQIYMAFVERRDTHRHKWADAVGEAATKRNIRNRPGWYVQTVATFALSS